MFSLRRQLRTLKAFRSAARSAGVSMVANLRWMPAWGRSQRKGASSMADESPWMTFGAIERMDRHLTGLGGKARVFEWGSGGSTLFFAQRAQEVIAVENDGAWAEQVRAHCTNVGHQHVSIVFRPGESNPGGEAADPEQFASGSALHSGETFQAYVEHILQFPDGSFDAVVVDGRARPACIRIGMTKVKPGGLLVLDNAGRSWYTRGRALADAARWPRTDYHGPGPYNAYFWETAVWQRPL